MEEARVVARRFRIRGRVQGVGFRYFVQRAASQLSIVGWVRNESDGSVQVYASGAEPDVTRLGALLRQGPRGAQVSEVDEREAPVESRRGFEIEG